MTSVTTTCPYCNSHVALSAETAPGLRVPCPRCGEAFAYRPHEGDAATPVPVPTTAARNPVALRRSNRVVAGAVLGGMVVMAIVGLAWALWTVPDRRAGDRREPIKYLPGDVDVIVAVHVTRSMETQGGQEFLRQFGLGRDPQGGPVSLGRWTGLRAEDIDQFVLGMKVADRLLPRMTLVVKTREPFNEEDQARLRTALKATQEIERGKKTVHQFQIERVPFPMELWFPADDILVVGLAPDGVAAVPDTPQPDMNHLPSWAQLHRGLQLDRDQVGVGAHGWVIGHAEQWDKAVPVQLLLRQQPKEDQKLLGQVQTLALWFHFDQAIRMTSASRCRDAAAAEALKGYLTKNDLAAPEAIDIKQDVWVTTQSEIQAEAIRRRVGQWGRIPQQLPLQMLPDLLKGRDKPKE